MAERPGYHHWITPQGRYLCRCTIGKDHKIEPRFEE